MIMMIIIIPPNKTPKGQTTNPATNSDGGSISLLMCLVG